MLAIERAEATSAGGEQVRFGEGAVELVATAHQALVHRVFDGHPFDDEMTPGESMTEVEDCWQRDLLHQDEVVDDGKHQHQVELCFEAGKEGDGFSILPTDCRCGTSNVCVDRLDCEIAL